MTRNTFIGAVIVVLLAFIVGMVALVTLSCQKRQSRKQKPRSRLCWFGMMIRTWRYKEEKEI